MKGTLIKNDKGWFILYDDDKGTYSIDVRPNRIEDLNKVGVHLEVNSEVDFMMEDVSYFPYRYAVPYVENSVTEEGPLPTSTIVKPLIRTKKQYKITLWLVGFPDDEVEVICDAWDCSSSGYFYFYNQDEQTSRRRTLCCYPIQRTAFHEIEEVETEY